MNGMNPEKLMPRWLDRNKELKRTVKDNERLAQILENNLILYNNNRNDCKAFVALVVGSMQELTTMKFDNAEEMHGGKMFRNKKEVFLGEQVVEWISHKNFAVKSCLLESWLIVDILIEELPSDCFLIIHDKYYENDHLVTHNVKSQNNFFLFSFSHHNRCRVYVDRTPRCSCELSSTVEDFYESTEDEPGNCHESRKHHRACRWIHLPTFLLDIQKSDDVLRQKLFKISELPTENLLRAAKDVSGQFPRLLLHDHHFN